MTLAKRNRSNMSETVKLINNKESPPKDKFQFVYLIFYLMGIGSLLPWNFFITANDYFMYKLRNTTTNSIEPTTDQQKDFESDLAVAATIPNVLFNIFTVIIVKYLHQKYRISLSFLFIAILLFITIIFVNVNSDDYQNTFFIIVMITIVLLSASSSVLTASVFGLASIMPVNYIAAVMNGQALGGTIAALAHIFSIAASGSESVDKNSIILSANIFFASALTITVIALVGYACLFFLKFSQFYMLNDACQTIESADDYDESEVDTKESKSFMYVLKRIWRWGLASYLIFLVTLSCFPGIASLIKPVNEAKIVPWFRPFFTPTVCFLCFNAADLSGRIVASKFQLLKLHYSNLALLLACLRICFIPLLMQCNTVPSGHLPSINTSIALFNNNITPVVLITLLGFTNGYLGNLCMMYGPQLVSAAESERAGTIMSLFLTLGLASGSVISLILVKFL